MKNIALVLNEDEAKVLKRLIIDSATDIRPDAQSRLNYIANVGIVPEDIEQSYSALITTLGKQFRQQGIADKHSILDSIKVDDRNETQNDNH